MRTIRISEEVWKAIAGKGKFGETPDDVLRRVFQIGGGGKPPGRVREATRRLTARVTEGCLSVSFLNGPSEKWLLPSRDKKAEIRTIRDKAVQFAAENGATFGQQQAVMKALTEAGYHLTK